MKIIKLVSDEWGSPVCVQYPIEQNHGDIIKFILPDGSSVMVRVVDNDKVAIRRSCVHCPFLHGECPVIRGPNQDYSSCICPIGCVYEKVGSSMEEL
jgi:hypothetical protein